MSAIKAVFLGIIQGLAEFLPISSSGHLAFFHNIFGTETGRMSFDLLLHLGTLGAVCIVYYKDIWKLILAFFSLCKKIFAEKFRFRNIKLTSDEKFLIMIAVALIPLVIGALIEDAVEFVGMYTVAIGVLWIVNGILLFVSDRIAEKRKKDAVEISEKNKTIFNALKVGFCQLVAIFPGISRSGMTITGGLLCGFDREYAVKFSFILSIPAILGANILSIKDFTAIPASDIIPYILGMIAALLSGLVAIKLLRYISKRKDFRVFSVYCIALGVLAIILGIVK
ncbi:MAG: undecaprenyl-diphosphate phosphatase [Clostridia bacterium]|nr:undecaprenyl-diphosphate phosphatase [Clostridia bacterium]